MLNTLGIGFLEKVYANAVTHEVGKVGLAVVQQYGLTVSYDGAPTVDMAWICGLSGRFWSS